MTFYRDHFLFLICFCLNTYMVFCVDSDDYKIAVALHGEIAVIDRNGGNYTIITNDVKYPYWLSYDSIHGYLYFVDGYDIKRLRYPSADNETVEKVVSNSSGTQVVGMSVDELHGYIFWSDMRGTIRRSTLNGSGETIIIQSLKFVLSLAVDPENEWIYHSYHYGVTKSRLNGSDCHVLLSGYDCFRIEIERKTSSLYCSTITNGISEFTLEGNKTRTIGPFPDYYIYNVAVINDTIYLDNQLCSIIRIDISSGSHSVVLSESCINDLVVFKPKALPAECNNFTWTDIDERRSSGYATDLSDQLISDHVIVEGWYRHIGRNGDIIPIAPPGVNHCGTIHPIWLNGNLPIEDYTNVSETACVQTEDDVCKHSLPINITKCGGFYVYYLTPTPKNAAYCFGSGEVACPAGMSSETGYHPGCSSSYPHIEVSTSVRSELIHGSTYNIPSLPPTPSLEAIFRCHFDITDPGSYVYDVTWYINGNEVKRHTNIPYVNINSTLLKNSDWLGQYKMNMQVSCAIRLRNHVNSVPGPYYRSTTFYAGFFSDKQEYTVVEGQSIHIPFRSTVPIGCMASHVNFTSHCFVSIYLHQPDENNSQESCTNDIASMDIIFKAQFCGIKLLTTDWEKTHNLEVFGYSDGLYNVRGRTTFIRLSTSSMSFLNEHWQHVKVPEIKVNVIDKDASLSNRLCQSYNDPHISTYDGKYYHLMEIGEFVMYRNDKGPYWVHALLTNCGFGWSGSACHCGVAIRSRLSLFILRTCKIVSRTQKELLTTPITTVKICDENDMLITSNTNGYKVKLPIGTEITLSVSRWSGFIGTVTIKPSIYDIGEAKGLCGVPSITKDPSDDYMHRTDGPVSDDQEFAKSWRITSAEEQLFVEEPMFFQSYVVDLNNGVYRDASDTYCLCEGQAGSTDDLADFNTAHCNLTGSTEYCSTDSTSTSGSVITSQYTECRTSLRRRRRSIEDTSDDLIDNTPLEIDDDIMTTSVPGTFRNGWTRETAYTACQNQLAEAFPPEIYDEFMELSVDNYIESCLKDIELTGDTSFLSDTIDAMIVNVMTELSRNESLYINNSTETGGQTVLEQIMSQLCKNNCSSNGQCVQGSCRCHEGYISDDCSVERAEPPRNISVPSSGLCRMGERACRRTNVFGNFLSNTVWYQIRQYKVKDDSIQYVTDWQTKTAEYRNMFMVTVDLERSRRKRSTVDLTAPRGYDISLSYDGHNYGEYVSILIYDENCYSCNSSLVCVLMESCQHKIKISSSEGKQKELTLPIHLVHDPSFLREPFNTVTVAISVGCIVGVILIVIAFVIYKVKCAEPKSKVNVVDAPTEAKYPKISRENSISDIQFQFDDMNFPQQEKFDRQRPQQMLWKPSDQFQT